MRWRPRAAAGGHGGAASGSAALCLTLSAFLGLLGSFTAAAKTCNASLLGIEQPFITPGMLPASRPPRLAPYCFTKCALEKSLELGPHHWMELKIKHRPLEGITAKMMLWFFNNLEGDMVHPKDGKTYPRNLVWHPRDHIEQRTVAPSKTPGDAVGALWRISEFLVAKKAAGYVSTDNPCRWAKQFYANSDLLVEKLDLTGLSAIVNMTVDEPDLGLPKFSFTPLRLKHDWADSPEGLTLDSTFTVGTKGPPFEGATDMVHSFVNQQVGVRFGGTDPVKAGRLWQRHALEEMSNLKHLIPLIYPKP